MSYFPKTNIKLLGAIYNGFAYFEYRACQNKWGIDNGFIYEIAMSDNSTRCANIKKTVAHVCIDEDSEGKPITETWKLKKHNIFN